MRGRRTRPLGLYDWSHMGTTCEREAQRSVKDIELIANSMRHDIIRMLEAAKSGHPGGSLSASDIVATLFFSGVMDYDANSPEDHGRDRFFLSKGHAAPVLYAAFRQLGWVTDEDLLSLRKLGGRLQGHPDCHALPFLEICSGSLGQGLSVAAGCALGLKMDDEKTDKTVFTLLGDGEMQEGSVWEAMMFAAHKGLDNLVAIVDWNNLQIDGRVDDVCDLGDLEAKFKAFGWHTQVVDGHDVAATLEALEVAKAHKGRPAAILAKTVKGKGVSFMEDKQGWHGSAPNAEQAQQAIAELDEARETILKEA